jgi:hypothetical protein
VSAENKEGTRRESPLCVIITLVLRRLGPAYNKQPITSRRALLMLVTSFLPTKKLMPKTPSIFDLAKEDYHLYVNLTNGGATVDNVRCKVYLPKKFSDQPALHLWPSNDQGESISRDILPRYKVHGEAKDRAGNVTAKIQADDVWSLKGARSYFLDADIKEVAPFIGKPRNLEIINYFSDRLSDGKTCGWFWITPNELLAPIDLLKPSDTGGMDVETIRQQDFTLSNGLHLIFKYNYVRKTLKAGGYRAFTALVAEFRLDNEEVDSVWINELLRDLDDFLLLVSFAARQRCVCHGWYVENSKISIEFCRREIVIPKLKRKGRTGNELIDLADFREFIDTAYSFFVRCKGKKSIRRVINALVPASRGSAEMQFISLLSSLESLVNAFYDEPKAGKILSSNPWDCLQKDLKLWLETHDVLAQRTEECKLILDRLNYLNLIKTPFASVLAAFCKTYNADVSDLWHVIGSAAGESLYSIRSGVVHGSTLDKEIHEAFLTALIHLQWIIERLLLALFGWPVGKSDISSERVAKYLPYQLLNEHRDLMTKVMKK